MINLNFKISFLKENDVVFIMTNMIITPRQKQGTCPELDEYEDAKCQNDTHCVANKPIDYGHGMFLQQL